MSLVIRTGLYVVGLGARQKQESHLGQAVCVCRFKILREYRVGGCNPCKLGQPGADGPRDEQQLV